MPEDPELLPDVTLTNGTYIAFVTPGGSGYSALGDQLLTTWSGDRIEDRDGFFIYVRDMENLQFWSAGLTPVRIQGNQTGFTRRRTGCHEITRTCGGIETVQEICVAPHQNMELRRVTVANRSRRCRKIELTSYAEVVLTDRPAFLAHPAFHRLFVQTGYDPESGALLAWRRPRSTGERHPWLVHSIQGPDSPGAVRQYETDRGRFVGRGGSLSAPAALSTRTLLSRTVGNVLDPIVSLRGVVQVEPGQQARITFMLGAAPDREQALFLVRRSFLDTAEVDRAFEAQAAAEGQRDG